MPSTRRVAVGIDLGTTNSCVAVFRNGHVDVIANGQGFRTTPSCVAFTDEERLIGDAAKAQASINHQNTVYEVKRIIGRKFDDISVREDMKNWPFRVISVDGNPKIEVTYRNVAKRLTPEEISAMILMEMKKVAEVYLTCDVLDAVITVPAYFSDSQRQATKDAGKIAGLNVLSIINEPTAAALAYGIDKNISESRNILVYDLGGGTFDVVILTITDGNFVVKAVGGDTHLGGSDFDKRLVKHFQDIILQKHGVDISKNMKATGRLKSACEKAKVQLSSSVKATIAIDALCNGVDFTAQLTRNRFEDICGDLFQNTLEHVKKVLSDARITTANISEVVLVGGSTRIPKVKELLQTFFQGKKLNQTINPDEAVAYGAAVKAALSSGESSIREFELTDVIPFSLGLENDDGQMITSIKRNTPVPITDVAGWTTPVDFMRKALFCVYEGENSIARKNRLLGSFQLENIEVAPRGVPKFEVTSSVDRDGILTVTAVDKKTRSRNNIVITTSKGRLSTTEISRMMKEVQLSDDDDEEEEEEEENDPHAKVKAMQAKDILLSYCFCQKLLVNSRSVHDAITDMERQKVVKWLNDAIDWMEANGDLREKDYLHKMGSLKKDCSMYLAKLHK